MNKIVKGLMLKDLLQLKDFKFSLLFWTIVFGVVSVVFDIAHMYTLFMAFGFGMIVTLSFTFDEMGGAERYVLCMPARRKDIILSKYLLSFGTSTVGALLGWILGFALQWIMHGELGDSMLRWFGVVLLGIFTMAVINSIQIPCTYKYGVAHSRISFFLIIASIVLIYLGVKYLLSLMGIDLAETLETFYNQYWIIAYIVLTGTAYVVSYYITCRLYEKKDI